MRARVPTRRGALAATACLLLAVGAAHAADVKPNLRAGNWRIAIAMEVPNATGPATGPAQYDRCLTPEDTRNLLMMPPGSQCSLRQSKLERDMLTWQVQCNQNGILSQADGRIEFKDTRIAGRIVTVAPSAGIRITTQLEGRYLGACVGVGKPAPGGAKGPGPGPAPRIEAPKPGEKLPTFVE